MPKLVWVLWMTFECSVLWANFSGKTFIEQREISAKLKQNYIRHEFLIRNLNSDEKIQIDQTVPHE